MKSPASARWGTGVPHGATDVATFLTDEQQAIRASKESEIRADFPESQLERMANKPTKR